MKFVFGSPPPKIPLTNSTNPFKPFSSSTASFSDAARMIASSEG